MATLKLYLDSRATKDGSSAPLKAAITNKGATTLIALNIKLLPSQWDDRSRRVTNHPNKLFLNNYIARRVLDIETILLKLTESGSIGKMKLSEIKKCVLSEISPEEEVIDCDDFISHFKKFTNNKNNKRTNELYRLTLKHIERFDSRQNLKFQDVTKDWLIGFDVYLSKTSPSKNARNIHMRNIRAVFNDAIDDEITTHYPFRKFKIKGVATAKRSLSVEQLREYINCPVDETTEKYLDMFKLIFFLIGINVIDLCHLKEIKNGRIEYYRAKTSRLYSIKIEPEAAEILKKYKGEKYLLNIMDSYVNYKNHADRLNGNLQQIGSTTIGKRGKKIHSPMFTDITTYWARHTWATIAASLDIPKETIAAALGHGGNTVTDIYINFDIKKVDAANRKVLDFVLYNKIPG